MMKPGAILSEDGLFRFALCRAVGFENAGGSVLFVMHNPSTADATVNDPTIRRCLHFAGDWGFDRLTVGNVNPTRATKPKDATIPPPEILAQNDEHLASLAIWADLVVAAWGAAAPDELVERAVDVVTRIRPMKALALTAAGRPRHPLYLKASLEPFAWR